MHSRGGNSVIFFTDIVQNYVRLTVKGTSTNNTTNPLVIRLNHIERVVIVSRRLINRHIIRRFTINNSPIERPQVRRFSGTFLVNFQD